MRNQKGWLILALCMNRFFAFVWKDRFCLSERVGFRSRIIQRDQAENKPDCAYVLKSRFGPVVSNNRHEKSKAKPAKLEVPEQLPTGFPKCCDQPRDQQ